MERRDELRNERRPRSSMSQQPAGHVTPTAHLVHGTTRLSAFRASRRSSAGFGIVQERAMRSKIGSRVPHNVIDGRTVSWLCG